MEPSSSRPDKATSEQGSVGGDRVDPLSDQPDKPDQSGNGNDKQSAKAKDLYAEEVGNTSSSLDLSQLGEFVYYKPTLNSVAVNVQEDLPPDFLKPTIEDIRTAQASLASRARAYREAPLLTEKLRKQREEKSRDKFPMTTIRVKFADRSFLEKTFPSSSLIKSVYAFVRSCLREDAKAHKFVLFETPPRRDLRVSDPNVRDKTLFDLHLTPRSILHFRFLEEGVTLDPTTGPPPLYPEILFQAIEFSSPALQEASTNASSRPTPTVESANSKGRKLGDSSDKDKKIARFLRLPGKK